MNKKNGKVLLIGYGNPGRQDDGLGPALADAVAALNLDGLDVDSNYQLSVEDAEAVAAHGRVIFADADLNGPEPFSVKRIEPSAKGARFSTHSLDPGAVLALARDLFKATPEAYLLGIRGYEFNSFGEGLSLRAKQNLKAALEFVETLMRQESFEESKPNGNAPARPGSASQDEDE